MTTPTISAPILAALSRELTPEPPRCAWPDCWRTVVRTLRLNGIEIQACRRHGLPAKARA